MIGNSVTSDLRATAHGFAMTIACAARSVWWPLTLTDPVIEPNFKLTLFILGRSKLFSLESREVQ